MPKEERREAMAADPVVKYRGWLIEQGHATEEELADIEARTTAEIDAAVQFALDSPQPDLSELYTDVYAEVTK
jgi:pyruvate dehydrogenase E1 component alpha subunit